MCVIEKEVRYLFARLTNILKSYLAFKAPHFHTGHFPDNVNIRSHLTLQDTDVRVFKGGDALKTVFLERY